MEKRFDVKLMDEAKEFILDLDVKIQRKIAYNIQKSREVNDPKILKKITREIWEFRTKYQKTQVRLLAFWDPSTKSLVICTHGFIKKTPKTPTAEIDKAMEIRRTYLNER